MNRLLLLVLFISTLGMAICQVNNNHVTHSASDANYLNEPPDVMPEYPGGVEAISAFLSKNVVYPPKAVKDKIQGKVLVRFIVDKNGNVSKPEVIQSVHPLLDAEALRVVGLLKGFTPGKKYGQAINTWYLLPVTFKLQADLNDTEKFDAVAIDSVAYHEMMDLGLAAQQENNLADATAYFKKAYHINPYSTDPLERIVKRTMLTGNPT